MGPTWCSETSITTNQLTPPNIPEERKPPLNGSGSLKSKLQTAAQSIDVCLFFCVYLRVRSTARRCKSSSYSKYRPTVGFWKEFTVLGSCQVSSNPTILPIFWILMIFIAVSTEITLFWDMKVRMNLLKQLKVESEDRHVHLKCS